MVYETPEQKLTIGIEVYFNSPVKRKPRIVPVEGVTPVNYQNYYRNMPLATAVAEYLAWGKEKPENFFKNQQAFNQ